MRRKRLALVTAAALMGFGCGDKKEGLPDEKTVQKLVECQSALKRQETATEMCTKQLDEASGGGGELTVTIKGETATITGDSRRSRGNGEISPEQAEKLSAEFNDLVRKSRGAIQKCYVQALKKNENIQGRTIELTVGVTVTSNGDVRSPSFHPRIGDDFEKCMRAVANRWELTKYNGGSIRLQYPVTLTPAD